MKNRSLLLFLCIFLVGIALRLLWFGMYPPELNRDEAALGYNAFALLQSGKDEWGAPFPLVFRSFGDYKLAGYIYTLIPFVKLFGLAPWVVRLPSLLAGIALIPLAYFFVETISKNKGWAMVSALSLALAPWALHYSKVGFEANLGLSLFVLSLILLLRHQKKSVGVGLLVLLLSFLTYNAPLLLLPGVLFVLWLTKTVRLQVLAAMFLVGVVAFALVYPATAKKTSISIFSDVGIELARRDLRTAHQQSLAYRLFSRKEVYYTVEVAKRYALEFSPRFLVISGGQNPWHQAPGRAHLGWMMYMLALIGIGLMAYQCIKQKKQYAAVFLGFLAIAPLPAAITVDAPHATRSLFFFVLLGISCAYAVRRVLLRSKIAGYIILFLIIIETSLYAFSYQSFATRAFPEWNTGMREAIAQAESQLIGDERITIVGDTTYTYIYPLFYTRMSPGLFQQSAVVGIKNTLGFVDVSAFGHYLFTNTEEEAKTRLVITQENGKYGVK